MKRFWQDVSVVADDAGYEIRLDSRKLKTPLKSDMFVPTSALAELIAQEWREVEGEVKPEAMQFTKFANSTIDYVPKYRVEMVDNLAAYVETDVLSYRAEAPAALAAQENEAWNPWLEWAAKRGLVLNCTKGVLPIAQPPETRARAESYLNEISQFEMMPMQEFVLLTGSFVLGLALYEGDILPERAFQLSNLEALFQEALWGADEEAVVQRAHKLKTLIAAKQFLDAARP